MADKPTPEQLAEYEARFQQRFDIARMVLERKYRWAKLTIRNLQPVLRDKPGATMAVDKWGRLYHSPVTEQWTDKQFVGALWHEVNHLLRHHPDRLEELAKVHQVDGSWVNLAADLEINDDMKDQGMELPDGVAYSEDYQHDHGLAAEDHFYRFIEEMDPGSNGEGDEGDDEEDGEGEGGAGGLPDPNGKPSKKKAPNNPNCGSGSGGDPQPDEQGDPDEQEQDSQARNQERQDEEIVKQAEEAEQSGGGLPPGLSRAVVEAAIERIGKAEHDWRRTFATEVRNAMEQKMDEAEEYTFKRRSRRAEAVGDEFILPGSFRPVPKLGVTVDLSGSMDRVKLEAAMREVHNILERLAIPEFTVYPWNTDLITDPIAVRSNADIKRVFEHVGGGTDMHASVDYAVEHGDEVVVVLTDNETYWRDDEPGVPVIIGGIHRSKEHTEVPRWARVVDVTDD